MTVNSAGSPIALSTRMTNEHWAPGWPTVIVRVSLTSAASGSSMRQPQSTQGLDDDSDQHFRVRTLALGRVARSLREECPPFADRLAKLRAANDTAGVLKLFYGVRDLITLPMAEWPKTETLAWWGT